MLWHHLKRAVHARNPRNIDELKLFCREEWSKIPPHFCLSLISSYRKHLLAGIAAKRGSIRY
ncbi:hypothetical protein LDENG_00099310 [Lucifuga dentata]|nr:hypothetical protein LDENG_00099310 [Lucifuga dentata]